MYRFVHVAPPKQLRQHRIQTPPPTSEFDAKVQSSRIEAPLRFAMPPCKMTLRRDSSVDRCHALVRRFTIGAPNEYHDYDDFSLTAVRQIVLMAEKGGRSRIDRCGNHGGVCMPGALMSAKGALATL